MSRLAPNMFDRRYADLVELGRSVLPSSAPAWTDYNAHDPGITLIELLAWVAEAQIYSLSKSRRDERRSYARLMGVTPHGTRPASGLIWPAGVAINPRNHEVYAIDSVSNALFTFRVPELFRKP